MRRTLRNKSFIALLLVLVFGIPIALQALHGVLESHSHERKQLTSGLTVSKQEVKCAICDFKFYLFTTDVLLIAATLPQQLHTTTNDHIAERHFDNNNRTRMGRAPPILLFPVTIQLILNL